MERFFVTIFEPTLDLAIAKASVLPEWVGVELRADACGSSMSEDELGRFRSSVMRPLLFTRRTNSGLRAGAAEQRRALAAGFEWVDLEFTPSGEGEVPMDLPLDRVLASVHDYEGMPDLALVLARLNRFPHMKIAASPKTLAHNLELLRVQRELGSRGSIFGMGAAGLYSRYLAPFLGGRPAFIAADEESIAAPGQLTLTRAMEVYGADERSASIFFAVVGNPASHSRSPAIHNGVFRAAGIHGGYGVLEVSSIGPVLDAMDEALDFAPTGVSITAPFKVDAFEWARSRSAAISDDAVRAGSANTAVRMDGELVFDNTDVAGFRQLLGSRTEKRNDVALVGAGGTARAAAVALTDLGMQFTVANRTRSSAEELAACAGARATDLEALSTLRPNLVIDTLPAAAEWKVPSAWMRSGVVLLRADYSELRGDEQELVARGGELIEGYQLLVAQAETQARNFLRAADPTRDFTTVPLPEGLLR